MSWKKDHDVLTSRELGRMEFQLRTVLEKGQVREATEICGKVNEQIMPQLSPLGRRKLSQRITKAMKKSSAKHTTRHTALLESHEVRYRKDRNWESIEFKCISCQKTSSGQFLPVWPCGHKAMCENCAMQSDMCALCNSPIDHKEILSLRKDSTTRDRRVLLVREAEAERKAANRAVRLEALRNHRKLVLKLKNERSIHDQKLQNARVQREKAEEADFQARAVALREGKALKRQKAKRHTLFLVGKLEQKALPPLFKEWKERKSIGGRDGDGLDCKASKKLEIMDRTGFRVADWDYDENTTHIPFVLRYSSQAAAARLARDTARDTRALEEFENFFVAEENIIREHERREINDMQIYLDEHELMVEEDINSGFFRLYNSTLSGERYDSEKRRLDMFILEEQKRIEHMQENSMDELYDVVACKRTDRKGTFVNTVMDLQYTSSALRDYFDYCVSNGIFSDGLIVKQLVKGALPALGSVPEDGSPSAGSCCSELVLLGGRLSDKQAFAVAHILPKLMQLERIHIAERNLGDEGLNALLDSVRLLPNLSSVAINESNMNNTRGKYKRRMKSVEDLMTKFCRLGALTTLDLSNNNIGDQGVIALSRHTWSCAASLHTLSLSSVRTSPLIAKHVVKLVKQFNGSLKHFDFSWNELRTIGLRELLQSLVLLPRQFCLYTLNLSFCGLNDGALKQCGALLTCPSFMRMESLILHHGNSSHGNAAYQAGHNLSMQGREELENMVVKHEQRRLDDVAREEEEERQQRIRIQRQEEEEAKNK